MKLTKGYYKEFGVLILIVLFAYQCKPNKKKTSSSENDRDSLAYYISDWEGIFTAQDNSFDTAVIRKLEHYYKYFWELNDLYGSVLVAKGDTILFESYRGFYDKNQTQRITSNTPLHLASISKTLTALVILKLVEKNVLSLQDSIGQYYPTFPYPEITIFDLLTHRTGLGDYGAYAETEGWFDVENQRIQNKDIIDIFASCQPPLFNPPGKHFSYCNTNYALLALIIEKVTQRTYAQAMKDILFDPLGMKNSFVFTPSMYNTVSVTFFNNKKFYPWDFRDEVVGDKNIYSTPRDLFQLSKAMYSKEFLRKTLLDSMFMGYSNEKKGINNYGLGIRLKEFENGKTIQYHTGWWHGSNTLFIHLLDEKVTIIALGNRKSKAVYSAFTLTTLFGPYPLELEELDESQDSINEQGKDTIINVHGYLDNAYQRKKDTLQKPQKPVEEEKETENKKEKTQSSTKKDTIRS